MNGFEVPANVAEAVCQRWPDRGYAWRVAVGDELAALCARYDARPVAVMQARYGLVLAADTRSGPLVFRGSPDPDAIGQAQIAGALADLGVAPKLHEVEETMTGVWTVMDRVVPGTPLPELTPTPETPRMIAEMLLSLVNGPERSFPGLPSITDWLRSRLLDDNLTDLAPGRTIAPKDQRKEALHLLDEVAGSAHGLCHGDASTRNILADGAGQLLLIDPRGMVGDSAYDAAVIALKVRRYIPIPQSVEFFADYADLDVSRIHTWVRIADSARV